MSEEYCKALLSYHNEGVLCEVGPLCHTIKETFAKETCEKCFIL